MRVSSPCERTFVAAVVVAALVALSIAGCATAVEPAHPIRRTPPAAPPSPEDRGTPPSVVPPPSDPPPSDPPPASPPSETPPPGGSPPPPSEVPPSAPSSALRPIVLVHGIDGSPADFAVMIDRLVADGWPRDWIVAVAYSDPSWGCNVDNAMELADAIDALRVRTGALQVDLVAHSMGNLSARHLVKHLGGDAVVARYVGLGGMHQGLFTPCLSPLPVCVWQELCETGELIRSLNASPAAPPPIAWLSIAGGADDTVAPDRARLDGAINVVVEGVTHVGLLSDEATYALVRDALSR